MLQGEDLEFGLRKNRLVKLFGQLNHARHFRRRGDHEHGVRLDDCVELDLRFGRRFARPDPVQILIDGVHQLGERFRVNKLQREDMNMRSSAGAQPLDLADHFHHGVDVVRIAAENQDPQLGDRFDRHVALESLDQL